MNAFHIHPFRKRTGRFLPGALAMLLFAFPFTSASSDGNAEHQDTLAIVGATVLPMTGDDVLRDAVVVVQGERIIAVGQNGETRIPDSARVIDGSGRFLVPGLVDMHAHLPPHPGQPGDSTWRQLNLMLANGITTARSMSGHPGHPQLRDAILAENRLAPTLYVAAPAMHQGNTSDAATAMEKVRAAHAEGFDLIKSHHLPDIAVWQAVQDEAARLKMPVGGHLASTIPLERALASGQQVEHLDGYIAALLPEDSPARAVPFGQVPPPAVLDAVDRDRLDALAREVADANGWNVPTLALFERIADTETATQTLRAREEMRYVRDEALAHWAAQREQMIASGALQGIAKDFVTIRRDIVRTLNDAGAGIMAGSDTPQAFHLSGFGLHDELLALQRAGLAPLEALRTATSNPREYLASLPNHGSANDKPADFGIIAPGARADLLLLNADPSKDVRATRNIETVLLRGQVLDRNALDELLTGVAASVDQERQAAGPAGKVLLFRHAEKAGKGDDPSLSTEGRARAEALAQRFTDFAPRVIYATPTRRARETAAPLAAATGARLEMYDPRRLDVLAEQLRKTGGNVVVVGHSNTTPILARLLGGEPGPAIREDEYDRIYRIALPDGATVIERPSYSDARIADCVLPGVAPPARCGTVRVPETSTPGSRILEIHFAVLKATDDARLPPLLVAPGGPGLGGVQSAGGISQLFAPLRRDRDIWLVDQRGTGNSNRLDCELPADIASAFASLNSHDRNAVAACRDQLMKKADLAAYTTPAAINDLEKIRAALGAEKIDIFGMSYGTRVAAEYLRQYPQHVRATIIRAPAPVAMQLPLHTPRDAQQSLERVADACVAQPDCARAYPDFREDFRRVLARLEAGPVNVTVVDPRNGQQVRTEFTRDAFGSSMFFLLYIPEYYRQVPALINRAANGDFRPLVQAIAPVVVGTLDQVAWGLRWSVICNEDVARIDRGEIEALTRDTFFGAAPVEGDAAACDAWPRADMDAAYFEPLETGHPVLIVSGTMDPVAPPRWGEHMMRTLDNALHLPIEGASHLPVFPGCTIDIASRFLEDASFEGIDTSCANESTTPPFAVPEGES